MKKKRTGGGIRSFVFAPLAFFALLAQSPGGPAVRNPIPPPAARGGIGWSGTITIRQTYETHSETSDNHRSGSTTYTVNDLPHVQVDPEDCDHWEAQGIVTYTAQMESTTANKSPGYSYDETESGSGSGKMYLRLSSEDKTFNIDVFPTDIDDPETGESTKVGDTYKITAHGVSWVKGRTPERIETTEQRDENPNLTAGSFDTLQPSGCNSVRLSGTRTVSDGSRTTSVSWNLSRVGLEIVITPPDDLAKWVPKGSRSGAAESFLIFKGEVRARGGGGGDKDSRVELAIRLQSSALFGVCGNYPPIDGAKKRNEPDLRIRRAETSKEFKDVTEELITSGDYDYLITAKGAFAVGDKFTLVIDCRDYGAFGLLSADSPVPVRIEGYPGPVLDLPVDEDKNHIADSWEEENVASGESRSVSADDDSVPKGAGPGDGLSLFEEYRGFMVKGKHVRTDPSIKDFFVSSTAPGLTDKGTDLFGKTTAIKVRKVHRSEMAKDQVVNFQVSRGHIVDQKGAAIRITTQQEINKAAGSIDFENPGGLANYAEKWILLMKDADAETVAHELGHTVQIEHHGDGDYDLSLADCGGASPPAVCASKAVARAKLQPIAAAAGLSLDDFFIAVMHGENSGPLRCLMRYNSADFIETSAGVFVPYGASERVNMFCTDKAGTKCGDAARGECRKQIRISDKGR